MIKAKKIRLQKYISEPRQLTCPFCQEMFATRHGKRIYCYKPECETARKDKNWQDYLDREIAKKAKQLKESKRNERNAKQK